MAEVENSSVLAADESFAPSEDVPDDLYQTGNVTVGTRRQANGTIGSVYSGNKIKHLKKEDGIPLWRKDIQHQFLKLVFEDRTKVFTRQSDKQKNMDFADIYMDAMARSSKTSKILKDKLQNDKPAALSMAMVCLLVNFGRMNTTLNFFPEMRAQLRTYHSIPSLQAHQDPNAYKQLQDAPRLKSILKGASEDVDQPNTIEKIKEEAVPRTNPVNLIFVLAQYAPKVSELHFQQPRDFFDLVMRSTLSSQSRARAFLWLMWWYLESDFSREAALNNPFGPGQEGEGSDGMPIKVPDFESLTEEQANDENIDSPSELEFGEIKRLERKRILEEDEPLPRVNKRSKKGDYYDDDQASGDLSGRGDRFSLGGRNSGVSTPVHPSARRADDDDEDLLTPGQSMPSRSKRPKRDSSLNRAAMGQQRLVLKTKGDQTPDASPAPTGKFVNEHANTSTPAAASTAPAPNSSRRPRPLTQHQIAVEQNRRERIRYNLAKRKEEAYRELRQDRLCELPIQRYTRFLDGLPDGYDTDDEDESWGKGGLLPNPTVEEDYGEAASRYLSVIRKATRRLDRWDYENANGPKRDRKKEREERQKARQEAEAFDNALDIGGGRMPTSARSRARAARNAKRKAAALANAAEAEAGNDSASGAARKKPAEREGLAASATDAAAKDPSKATEAAGATAGADADAGTAEAAGAATPTTASRPSKSSRSRANRAGDGAATPAKKGRASSPTKPSSAAPAGEDEDGDVEALDDIDRELLGEASGDEAEAEAEAGTAPARPAGPGFEESFVEEDAEDEALSDVDADEEDLDDAEPEAEGHDKLSVPGAAARNGYAPSEGSSAVGDHTAMKEEGV